MLPLILASSSSNRRDLLLRLGLPFDAVSPAIDETPLPDEPAAAMVQRLARQKAEKVAADYPRALIIGCDQCALANGVILGKPGDHAQATAQLKAVAGKPLIFHTGLCLLDAARGTAQIDDVVSTIHFRPLSDTQIERYLRTEQPYQCAGSIRVEALGIALLEKTQADDPSAMIGLPLIRLVSMLNDAGVEVL